LPMRWPILETAGAAVLAWYLAKLLLSERETGFAPIAAVICLGATLGQQRQRALELTGGVILGVLIADLLIRLVGTGPPQVGLMVVLDLAAALETGDRARAEHALETARAIDNDVRALGDALTIGRETARSAPLRWPARAALDRQEEIGRYLDFAVRNTRVLARDTVRYM